MKDRKGEGSLLQFQLTHLCIRLHSQNFKSVAQYQPCVLLIKTIKEAFNWPIYPLFKSFTVPGLFGDCVRAHTHSHAGFSLSTDCLLWKLQGQIITAAHDQS